MPPNGGCAAIIVNVPAEALRSAARRGAFVVGGVGEDAAAPMGISKGAGAWWLWEMERRAVAPLTSSAGRVGYGDSRPDGWVGHTMAS